MKRYDFKGKVIWLIDDEGSPALAHLLAQLGAGVREMDPLEGLAEINKLDIKKRDDFPNLIITDWNFSEGPPRGRNPWFSREEDRIELPQGGRAIVNAIQRKNLGIPIIVYTAYPVPPVVNGATVINGDVEDRLLPAIEQALSNQRVR